MKKVAWLMLPLVLVAARGQMQAASAGNEYSVPEVVVTATRTDMDKKNIPAAVEVITRADIEARGLKTLNDAVALATGISTIRSTGRPAISIRGFESRFSVIMIDGKRLASEVDQNYELQRIALENVERIEIVRGPVSSLYGTDSLGGVVNIITKRPEERKFDLGLDWGGHRQNYNFTYDSGRIGKAGFVLSGAWQDNTAQLKSNGLTYEPFGTRQAISAKLDYRLSPHATLDVSAGYMNENTREYAMRVTPAQTFQANSNDLNDRYDFSVAYNYRKQDKTFMLRTYMSDYYKKLIIRRMDSSLFNYAESNRTIWGVESKYSFGVGENHLVTLGGEYRPERFRGTGVVTGQNQFTASYEGRNFAGSGVDISYAGLYAQDEWQISPKLLAIASVRYDGSSRFDSNVSPKIGFTYAAQRDLRLKLNYGQGFRSPTPNHLFINSTVQRNGKWVTLTGNPDLKSETSNSYELAVEKDWGKATAKATYFINKVENMIEEAYLTSNRMQYQNIGKATLQGLEAEISYPMGKHWNLSANYMALDAVNDTTGNRLFNRPRQKLSARLVYDTQKDWVFNLWTEAYSDYLHESSPGIGTNKSYMLWNLSGEKKIGRNTSLVLGLNNLLNYQDDDLGLSGIYIHGGIRARF
jgi:outer membrane receptor for ferrienterochelin and colicins